MLQFSMFLLIYSVMSLDREYFMCSDLVASGLFLLYSYLYTVMMTIFGGGGGGRKLDILWGSFYSSNTLDRTL